MSETPRILAFAGSARTDSVNKKLIRVAVNGAVAAGAECTLIDLRDYPLPIYDGDLEEHNGLPEEALALKRLFQDHAGLLISSPEYNSSISPLLKNTIDWVSRPVKGGDGLVPYAGKIVGLLAASPGGLGGLRGLVHVRSIFGNIGCLVLPGQFALSSAMRAFGSDGELTDSSNRAKAEAVGAAVAAWVLTASSTAG